MENNSSNNKLSEKCFIFMVKQRTRIRNDRSEYESQIKGEKTR